MGMWDTARDWYLHLLGRRGSAEFIRSRWGHGRTKPYQRSRLTLHPPGIGIGDNLMCTPILREIKRRNPACELTFLTRYPELFEGSPFVDHLVTDFASLRSRALRLHYDHLTPRLGHFAVAHRDTLALHADGRDRYRGYAHPTPPDRPLITILAECVGMEFGSTQLDCAVPVVSDEFRARVAAIPGPFVVLQPQASTWTPNKNWSPEGWAEVVRGLLPHAAVVEVGTESVLAGLVEDPRFVTMAGRTSVSEFLHLIREAAVYVGPDSGGMHVANAFHVPSVVLFGGYSSPESFGYPRTIALTGATDCAPCWLSTPCPFDRRCLTLITPAAVLHAVQTTLASRAP